MQSTLSGHLKLIFDDGVSSNPLKTDRNLFWETIIKHLALLSHLACYAYIMLIFMAECKIRPGHGYYIFHLRSIRCCEGQYNLWFFFPFDICRGVRLNWKVRLCFVISFQDLMNISMTRMWFVPFLRMIWNYKNIFAVGLFYTDLISYPDASVNFHKPYVC